MTDSSRLFTPSLISPQRWLRVSFLEWPICFDSILSLHILLLQLHYFPYHLTSHLRKALPQSQKTRSQANVASCTLPQIKKKYHNKHNQKPKQQPNQQTPEQKTQTKNPQTTTENMLSSVYSVRSSVFSLSSSDPMRFQIKK